MAVAKGHKARIGIGQQTDYNTALTVTDLIPFTSESLTQAWTRIPDAILCGKAGMPKDTRAGKTVNGNLTVEGVYDEVDSNAFGIELLLLAAMGTTSRTGDFNRYVLADILAEFLTIAVDKQIAAFEFIGAKCNGFTFSIDTNAIAVLDFPFICKNRFKTGDGSITNAIADITSLNKPSLTKLRWQDMTFRVANLDDAIAAADQVKVSSLSLSLTRNLDSDINSSAANSGHTDSELTEEPSEDEFREVEFSFTLPRFEALTYFTFWDNDTLLQADIKFASGTYNFDIFIPTMKIMDISAPIDSAGVLSQTITCTCFLRDAGNTTMQYNDAATDVDEEFGIEVDSDRVATP